VEGGVAVAAGHLEALTVGIWQPRRIEEDDRGGDVLAAGQQSAHLVEVAVARRVHDAVGLEREYRIVVGRGGDADRIPVDERACVDAVLGFRIDLYPDDVEVVTMIDDRRQQLAADRPWPPEKHPVRLVRQGGDNIRGSGS
jgi:hypothetical protein